MKITAALLLSSIVLCGPAEAQPAQGRLLGRVVDTSHLPVPGVTLTLTPVPPGTGGPRVTTTDGSGTYQFVVPPGRYTLTAELSGFDKIIRQDLAIGGDPLNVDLELRLAAFTQETQVVAQVPRVMSSGAPTAPSTIDKDVIKIAPVQGLRYDSALPLLPTTVRGPDGLISFGGARATQGTVLVDHQRETDPLSGEPALTVPITAIDTVQVFTPAPPADMGPGTAGSTLINSRRGADAYGFSVSAFVPRPRFGGGTSAINGIESWQPNLGISGPIVRGRAWFNQAAEYRWERFQNETPRGLQDTKLISLASFTRLDVKLADQRFVTMRVAIDPEDRQHFGLDAFAPASTVPNRSSRPMSAAITGRMTAGGDTFEVGFHLKRRRLRLFPVEDAAYSIGHDLAHGGFFRTVDRTADRAEASALWTHPSTWHGEHVIKAGLSIGRATVAGTTVGRPVDYLRSDNTVAKRVEFLGDGVLDASAADAGAFVQDSCVIRKGLKADFGARFDYAGALAQHGVWPRGTLSYAIDDRTKLNAGIGVFAATPTLNPAVFNQRQSRRVTTFDGNGRPIDIPQVFTDAVGGSLALARAMVVHVHIDRAIGRDWLIRAGFQQRQGARELVVNPLPAADGQGALVLTADGESRARSVEVTVGYRSANAARQFYVSYVESSATGNLNDLVSITGSAASALVLADARGPLAADVPHRLLAWGIVAFPWRLTIAPFLEMRSGFPFSPIDDGWDPAGPRNGARFPTFVSLDFAIEKALQLPKTPPLRLGLKFFNVTGHDNGRNIQADIARPDYGRTFNPIRRRTARFARNRLDQDVAATGPGTTDRTVRSTAVSALP